MCEFFAILALLHFVYSYLSTGTGLPALSVIFDLNALLLQNFISNLRCLLAIVIYLYTKSWATKMPSSSSHFAFYTPPIILVICKRNFMNLTIDHQNQLSPYKQKLQNQIRLFLEGHINIFTG